MAETTHTPGPWRSTPGDRTGFKTRSGNPSITAPARPSDDFFILQIAEMETNLRDAGEIEANARLIAAAPELYQALERLTAYVGALPGHDDTIAAYEEGLAALAKAGKE